MTGRADGRRSGPRIDLDVPSTIVTVAEQMFGETSVDSVSLRAVARQAGVAPAAVTYHFPSKPMLVAAVVDRRGKPVGREIRRRLAAVGAAPAPTVRDLVDAILLPLVAVLDEDPVGGLHWMKTVARLAVTDHDAFYGSLRVGRDLNELFTDACTVTVGPSNGALLRRSGLAMFGLLTALAGADLTGYGKPIGPDGLDPEFVEQLAAFTAAGLAADADE